MLTRIKIFPVARRNYCHKIKPQVYVHVFTSISVLQNSLSNTISLTALEILQLLHFYKKKFPDIIIIFHDFPRLFMTLAVFHDFPGLENGLTKFHNFPGRVVTLQNAETVNLRQIILNVYYPNGVGDSIADSHQPAALVKVT